MGNPKFLSLFFSLNSYIIFVLLRVELRFFIFVEIFFFDELSGIETVFLDFIGDVDKNLLIS